MNYKNKYEKKQRAGRGGGGAALTGEGQRMLDAFDAFEAELKETAARLFPQYFQEFISPEEDHAC